MNQQDIYEIFLAGSCAGFLAGIVIAAIVILIQSARIRAQRRTIADLRWWFDRPTWSHQTLGERKLSAREFRGLR